MLQEAHRQPGNKLRASGFTLVELLVVISIIALLVGILLPSLNAARARAQQVVCATRLKEWGLAFEIYALHNKGLFPHCDGLDREDYDPDNPDLIPAGATRAQIANWHGWVDKLPPVIDRQAWRYYPKWEHPQSDTFYQCPTAEPLGTHGMYSYKPEKSGYFSYAMNSCLELDRGAWKPPGGKDYPMPSFLDTARIVCPQRVILLFDQLLDPRKGYGGEEKYKSAGEHCGSYPISFSARHARGKSKLGGNLLHCDGHVEWTKTVWKPTWEEWQVGSQQGPPRDDRNWYPYPIR